LAEGVLQNQDGVIHVKAIRLTALVDGATELRSHDFSLTTIIVSRTRTSCIALQIIGG
jgi:hypothetical protein